MLGMFCFFIWVLATQVYSVYENYIKAVHLWSVLFCMYIILVKSYFVVCTYHLLFSWAGSKLEYESWDPFRIETIWELCSAFWGREASRKWEWASLQTVCVWGVVEGRMPIKIINNCWKKKWITTPQSDQQGVLAELRPPSRPCHKLCKGGHETYCWNFSPDR